MEGQVQLINMHDAVKGWAEVAIDKLGDALDDYEIGPLHGPIWQSLMYQLIEHNGDVEQVLIKFRQYGRFIDMRVGKGMKLSQRGQPSDKAGSYGRKKRPWYSRTKTREIGILRYVLVKYYGKQTLSQLENAFTGTETINPL